MSFFFLTSHHCFPTGVVLTLLPYAQTTVYTVSSLLQCRRSGDDVRRVTLFVCEKCWLTQFPNMIHIFIHWALGYTKQRHTKRKRVVVMVYAAIVCVFRVYASEGCEGLSAVDWRLDLSRQ